MSYILESSICLILYTLYTRVFYIPYIGEFSICLIQQTWITGKRIKL